MEFVHIFNSTIVVIWAVAFVPRCILEKDAKSYFATLGILLCIEILLTWSRHDFPKGIFVSIFILTFSSLGGWIVYRCDFKKDENNKVCEQPSLEEVENLVTDNTTTRRKPDID